jgi:hypothetical protein
MTPKKLFLVFFTLIVAVVLATPPHSTTQSPDELAPGHVRKNGVELDVRSLGRQIADQIAESGNVISSYLGQ